MDERLAAVKGRLEALLEPDQRLRGEDRFEAEDWAEQRDLDRENVAALSRIVETHGWPTERVFGEKAALAAFLVVQHAPLAVQERYLPLLQAATDRGDTPKKQLAFLTDRIRLCRNEPQLYGTQLRPDKETGRLELYPLQNSDDVDLRRA